MSLEIFLSKVHNEISSGISRLSDKTTYIKKPIFKGPNQIWYCAVENYSPYIIINFSHNIFSIEFNKLKVSSTGNLLDNELHLTYQLASDKNSLTTKNFRQNLLDYYDDYLNEYIQSFKSQINSVIENYKSKFNDSRLISESNIADYFEEPEIKIYRKIEGSKNVRHKPGEGFWISVHEHHSYEISTKKNFNDSQKLRKIEKYLGLRERHIHYEEEYKHIPEKKVKYTSKELDLDFSYMVNNVDLNILFQEIKQSNIRQHSNWLTKEILIFYSFLLFGDVNKYLDDLTNTYDKKSYWLLYESFFNIHRSYLDRSIKHLYNDFKDYSNNLSFHLPDNFEKINDEMNKNFTQRKLDSYFTNFVINSNLSVNEYEKVIELVYYLFNK